MSSFTLALSLLNILPAFHLDGEYALSNFITLLIASDRFDDQSMSASGLFIHQRAKRIEAFIVRTISVVVSVVIVGSILVGILNAAV